MRVHVIGLPHTDVTKQYAWCAYTQKILRLRGMLTAYGHEMVLYGSDPADVIVVTDEDRDCWFGGQWDVRKVFDRWEPQDGCWVEMNDHAIGAMRDRIEPGDMIGIIAGRCQAAIADAFPNNLALEWGVGYSGVLPRSLRAFESHAWRHYVSGYHQDHYGRAFDTVIPNAYDPDDLTFRDSDDGYLLYLGRPTPDKGLEVVAELAKRHRVVTAGQSNPKIDGTEYAGLVLGDAKAKLLAGARAVLVPTLYIEPFGGVAVEAMLSGSPVITSDFGAFPETVSQGVSGFRCNTLGEYVAAARDVETLDRRQVRGWADQFTVGAVAPQYDRWLRRCQTLYDEGWYQVAI